MGQLMFPSAIRKKLATGAARVDTVADLAHELSPDCALETNVLGEHADKLVGVIKSVLSHTQRHAEDGDNEILNTYGTFQRHNLEEHLESGGATGEESRAGELRGRRRTRRARRGTGARGSGPERGRAPGLEGNQSVQGQLRPKGRGS